MKRFYDRDMLAKIIRSSKREFECLLEKSEERVLATALASVLKDNHPVVGDYIRLEKIGEQDYQINEVLERKSEIFRRNVREYGKKKVVAANVDLMLVVMAASKPEYKSGLIDRYLVRAKNWGVEMMVVINKMDEFTNQFDLEFEEHRLNYLNIKYVKVSATEPKQFSDEVEKLKNFLKGQTAIFVGQSGVGKSKLITLLTEGKIELKSSKLAKVGKGAHTTTWSELIEFENFSLIDSPGIRSMALKDMDTNLLDIGFEDLFPLITKCKFKDCSHEPSSKGCYFNTLEENSLENLLILSRLDSYKKIRDEIEAIPNWQKKGLK